MPGRIKKICFIVLALTLYSHSYAQGLAWARQIGDTTQDAGSAIAVDGSGNVYIAGHFQNMPDFDPGLGVYNLSAAGIDGFIEKFDAAGNFLWVKQLKGDISNTPKSILIAPGGNIYITGEFSGMVDFDPGQSIFNLTSTGSADIFILKLDASGNFVWAKQVSGSDNDRTSSIAIDSFENIYVTGLFSTTCDFDPGVASYFLTSSGLSDIFILKFDSSGNFIWAKQIGGPSFDSGNSIILDAFFNIYITGSFMGSVDFDPGSGTFNLTSIGISDAFIQKLDPSGNFLWARQIGGIGSDVGSDVVLDDFNNIYTIGSFEKTVDFDPGTGVADINSAGSYDCFIQKSDASGNFIWAKRLGGVERDIVKSIKLDALGNIYTTGYFSESCDFDPGTSSYNLVSKGEYDAFISILSSAGDFLWARQTGSTGDDESRAIAVDNLGSVYTMGYFSQTTDFNTGGIPYNLTSTGSYDIFIQKISTPTSIEQVSDINKRFLIYPNPLRDELIIEKAKSAKLQIFDIVGRRVYEATLTQNKERVNTSGLSPGTYILLLTDTEGNRITKKIVKE